MINIEIHRSKSTSLKLFSFGIICLLAILSLGGCERDDAKFEGPNLNDLFGDFAILEDFSVSSPSVDFSKGETVHFKARFTNITNWTITITNQTSSAVKIIEGRSKVIDETNGSWDGTTTNFPVFAIGNCTATLKIVADSSEHTATISLLGLRTTNGIVIADFENGMNPKWTLFAQSGARMTFKIEKAGIVPQGSNYFDMGGEVNWDWLIGLIDFPAKAYNDNGFGLSLNPNDVYFNVLLNRPKDITNGLVLFQFKEDEDGNGTHTPAKDDTYSIELRDLKEGWQIVSVKYSDLVSLSNGAPTTPNGNNQKNPDKLHTVSCLFLANPASGYSQTLMDYLVFTNKEPLKL